MRVLLFLTVVAIAVSAIPAGQMPEETMDLSEAHTIEDNVVALVQEAKTTLGMGGGMDVLDLDGSKPKARDMGDLADLGEERYDDAYGKKSSMKQSTMLGESNQPTGGTDDNVDTAASVDFEVTVSIVYLPPSSTNLTLPCHSSIFLCTLCNHCPIVTIVICCSSMSSPRMTPRLQSVRPRDQVQGQTKHTKF